MPSKLVNLFQELQWSDFTKKKMPAPGAGQTARAAMTETAYKQFSWKLIPVPGSKPAVYRLDDNIVITIEFKKSSSWVAEWVFTKPKQFQDDLLNHERGHFKITALIARDLFIELMQLKQNTYSGLPTAQTEISAIMQRHSSAVIASINKKYDETSETNHGLNAAGQRRWDGYFNTAFTQARTPAMFSPDGKAYKIPLLDVLRGAGVQP